MRRPGRPVKPYTEGEERFVHVRLGTELTKALVAYCEETGEGPKTVVAKALQSWVDTARALQSWANVEPSAKK